MKPKKLGKLLDSGLDYLAVRIAQTAQRQGDSGLVVLRRANGLPAMG